MAAQQAAVRRRAVLAALGDRQGRVAARGEVPRELARAGKAGKVDKQHKAGTLAPQGTAEVSGEAQAAPARAVRRVLRPMVEPAGMQAGPRA